MSDQPNWAWCGQCQSLWFVGNERSRWACPTGFTTKPANTGNDSPHVWVAPVTGKGEVESGNYELAQKNSQTPQGWQDQWKWCAQCECLWYSGYPSNKGFCAGNIDANFNGPPTVSVHTDSGSGDYVLAMSTQANPAGQGGWRFCESCLVLWFTDNKTTGACPARPGQGHLQAQGGATYFLSKSNIALKPAPLQPPPG